MFDTSHISFEEYIDGDAFENLKLAGTVYIKTDEVRAALESHSIAGVLITHNSDLSITQDLVTSAFRDNSDIVCWFAQNATVKHPKLSPVPIGLERTRWCRQVNKRDRLLKFAERSSELPLQLCLANFSLSTNKVARQACMEAASSFATLQVADTVCQGTPETYARYLTSILEHKFVLCPEGNGVDTHRLWETLYLGRIPIVTRSVVTEAFASLPMVILDSWNDLSPALLVAYWEDFQAGRIPYTLNRLFMSFWKNRITAAVQEASQ